MANNDHAAVLELARKAVYHDWAPTYGLVGAFGGLAAGGVASIVALRTLPLVTGKAIAAGVLGAFALVGVGTVGGGAGAQYLLDWRIRNGGFTNEVIEKMPQAQHDLQVSLADQPAAAVRADQRVVTPTISHA